MYSLKINIGNVATEFNITDNRFFTSVYHKYKKFISLRSPDVTYLVVLEKKLKIGKDDFRIKISQRQKTLLIKRTDFISETNLKKRSGFLKINNNIFSFDSFLRIVYSELLLRKNCILLHSSACILGEYSMIFPGVSGAGKTTIVYHLPKSKILNDEIVGIKKDKNDFFVFSTPFWGSGGDTLAGNEPQGNYKLRAICFPVKAKEISIFPVVGKDSFKKLMRTVLVFNKNSFCANKILKFVSDILKFVTCYSMKFYPAKNLYEEIQNDIFENI